MNSGFDLGLTLGLVLKGVVLGYLWSGPKEGVGLGWILDRIWFLAYDNTKGSGLVLFAQGPFL